MACGGLYIVRSTHFSLNQASLWHGWHSTLGQRQHTALGIGDVRVHLQVRPVVGICGLPLVFIPFKLTAVPNKRCFRCQRQHFGLLRNPIVVHPLGVLGISHNARHIQLAVYLKLIAHHPYYGDVLTSPVLRAFQKLKTVGLAPLHHPAGRLTGTDGLQPHRFNALGLGRAGKRRDVVGIQVQGGLLVLNKEILSNPYRIFVDPLRDRRITHPLGQNRRDRSRIRVQALVFFLGDVLGDQAPLGISTTRVLDRGVHVDREAVSDPANLDVLIKASLINVLGQNPDVALTIRYLILASSVVGYVSVRDILNVTDDTVQDLSHLKVSLVVGRDNLA